MKRVKARRNAVMETAWRSRNFSIEDMTREASLFVKSALAIAKNVKVKLRE